MNLSETNALVAWVNQMDPLVSNTMASVEKWHASLHPFTVQEAKQAVFDHYRADKDGKPAIPGIIKVRCRQIRSVHEARSSARALPAPRPQTTSLRERNPELWARLVEAGKAERAAAGHRGGL